MELNLGIGTFASMLTLIFITLKLIGKIDWSWWWILSPLWISLLLTLFFFAVFAAIVYIFL